MLVATIPTVTPKEAILLTHLARSGMDKGVQRRVLAALETDEAKRLAQNILSPLFKN